MHGAQHPCTSMWPSVLRHYLLTQAPPTPPSRGRFGAFNCNGSEEDAAYATSQRIRVLPTFRVFVNGRCIDEVTGARPAALRSLLLHYYRP